MQETVIPQLAPNKTSFSSRFSQGLKRYFVTGLATLFPVTVTLWLVWKIFLFADGLLGKYLPSQIPGLGLLVTVLVILLVGIFTVHLFGRLFFRTIEILLVRLPLVRKIFPPVKQLAKFLFDEGTRETAFRGVALIEWPRLGSYSLAFVTNEWVTRINGVEETLVTVLVPTPPSPVTGPIVFLRKQDVTILTMSVEDAFKLILSGGVVASPMQALQRPNP